jgi:quercetin dioxygenase-like cupin family protein
VTHRVLRAEDAHWRPSNQMGVLNTDLARQLGAVALGARLWRLAPGQASTRHRHRVTGEMYVVLEGTGRLRVGEELVTLAALDVVRVEPDAVRQAFNDTDAEQLWPAYQRSRVRSCEAVVDMGSPSRGTVRSSIPRRAGLACGPAPRSIAP